MIFKRFFFDSALFYCSYTSSSFFASLDNESLKSVLIKSLSTSTSTTTTTNADLNSGSKPVVPRSASLFVSVCVERMPVITGEMDELEKRYSNLINEINVKKSVLSNHELRHLKDLFVFSLIFHSCACFRIYFESIFFYL